MNRQILLALAVILTCELCCSADVPNVPSPPKVYGGYVLPADKYNQFVQTQYNWVNQYIVALINLVTTLGSTYVYDGANVQEFPAGADGLVLTARSTVPLGIDYEAAVGQVSVTTLGDLAVANSSGGLDRLPVGADGDILTASSASLLGVTWKNYQETGAYPVGTIVAFSPGIGGATPDGWVVCDGTVQYDPLGTGNSAQTPNLIGLFVLGTDQPGGSASGATGGYGSQHYDTAGLGTISHYHSYTTNDCNTGGASAGFPGTTGPLQGLADTMAHVHEISPFSGNTSSHSSEPSDYALVYIMKVAWLNNVQIAQSRRQNVWSIATR